MHIFAIYLPGGSTNNNINRHFSTDIRKLTNRRISYFICGDFNAKRRFWNCNRANRTGTLLYDVYNRSNFASIHPPTSTHFPTDPQKTPSTIDLVLTNGIHEYCHLTCNSLSSDHNAVEFSVHYIGVDKVEELIGRNFYFSGIWKRLIEHVKNCVNCFRYYPKKKKYGRELHVFEKVEFNTDVVFQLLTKAESKRMERKIREIIYL